MNPEFEGKREESQDTDSDSFYEPRTIPKKWDVSAFVSRKTSSAKSTEDQTTESVEQDDTNSSEDEVTNWNPDPFPQPRTVPGKWDVSDLK